MGVQWAELELYMYSEVEVQYGMEVLDFLPVPERHLGCAQPPHGRPRLCE